ncbi:MAG: hypothetical protein WBW48_06965, partial [Anaerolineae bacterium]
TRMDSQNPSSLYSLKELVPLGSRARESAAWGPPLLIIFHLLMLGDCFGANHALSQRRERSVAGSERERTSQ